MDLMIHTSVVAYLIYCIESIQNVIDHFVPSDILLQLLVGCHNARPVLVVEYFSDSLISILLFDLNVSSSGFGLAAVKYMLPNL